MSYNRKLNIMSKETDSETKKAFDNAKEYCDRLPFEFYWDFAGIDKKLLYETVMICYADGYLKGREEL